MRDGEESTHFETGPIVTLQMLIVVVFILGVTFLGFLFGREAPASKPNLDGVHGSTPTEPLTEEVALSQLPNRKKEVDAAIADIDFEKKNYQVILDTTAGKITLDMYPDVAPGHCKNVIGLAEIGYYDGIIFHRVIKDFVCQVGCPLGTGTGGPGYTIDAEFNDKLHEAGVLSMARTSDPNSAGSQFFICLGRVPHLDKQYTVFGKTADDESLKNVLKFNSVKTGAGDRPVEEIKIKTAKVVVTDK
ncbi:peptidylprolyl isomerase [bacterium]|nr:peptidylprolyl isomerase [bacterium]